METPQPDLLPCPFCGGKPTFIAGRYPNGILTSDGDHAVFQVACENNCHFMPETGARDSVEEVARVWNTRPADPAASHTARELCVRITEYLSLGGLFNPEAMNHYAVRDLLMDCRAILEPDGETRPTAVSAEAMEFLIFHAGQGTRSDSRAAEEILSALGGHKREGKTEAEERVLHLSVGMMDVGHWIIDGNLKVAIERLAAERKEGKP